MGFLDTYLRARGIADPEAPLTQDQRSEIRSDKTRLLEILERYTRNINKNFSSERIASLNAQVDYFDAVSKSRDRLLETKGKDRRVAMQSLQRLRTDLNKAQVDLATSRGSVNQALISSAARIATSGTTLAGTQRAEMWNLIVPYFDDDPTMTNLQFYATIKTLSASYPKLISMEDLEAGRIDNIVDSLRESGASAQTIARLQTRLPQAHGAYVQMETAENAINATNDQLDAAELAIKKGSSELIDDTLEALQGSLTDQEAAVSTAYDINATKAQASLQEFQRNDYLTDQIKELVEGADPARAAKLRDLKSQAIQNPAFQQWAEDHGYTLGFVDEQGTYFPRPADDRALRHFRNEFNRGPGKYGTMRGGTGQIVEIVVPGGEPETVTPEPTFFGTWVGVGGGSDPTFAFYDSEAARFYVPQAGDDGNMLQDSNDQLIFDEYDRDGQNLSASGGGSLAGTDQVEILGVFIDPGTGEFMSRVDYLSRVADGDDPAFTAHPDTPRVEGDDEAAAAARDKDDAAYQQAAAPREVAPPPKVIVAERMRLNAADSVQSPDTVRYIDPETGESRLTPASSVTVVQDTRSGQPLTKQALDSLQAKATQRLLRRAGDRETADVAGATETRQVGGVAYRRTSTATPLTLAASRGSDMPPGDEQARDQKRSESASATREAKEAAEDAARTLKAARASVFEAKQRRAAGGPDPVVGPGESPPLTVGQLRQEERLAEAALRKANRKLRRAGGEAVRLNVEERSRRFPDSTTTMAPGDVQQVVEDPGVQAAVAAVEAAQAAGQAGRETAREANRSKRDALREEQEALRAEIAALRTRLTDPAPGVKESLEQELEEKTGELANSIAASDQLRSERAGQLVEGAASAVAEGAAARRVNRQADRVPMIPAEKAEAPRPQVSDAVRSQTLKDIGDIATFGSEITQLSKARSIITSRAVDPNETAAETEQRATVLRDIEVARERARGDREAARKRLEGSDDPLAQEQTEKVSRLLALQVELSRLTDDTEIPFTDPADRVAYEEERESQMAANRASQQELVNDLASVSRGEFVEQRSQPTPPPAQPPSAAKPSVDPATGASSGRVVVTPAPERASSPTVTPVAEGAEVGTASSVADAEPPEPQPSTHRSGQSSTAGQRLRAELGMLPGKIKTRRDDRKTLRQDRKDVKEYEKSLEVSTPDDERASLNPSNGMDPRASLIASLMGNNNRGTT